MPSEVIKFNGGISRLRHAPESRPYSLLNARYEHVGSIRGMHRGSVYAAAPTDAKPYIYEWGSWLDNAATAKGLTCNSLLSNVKTANGGATSAFVEGSAGTMVAAPGMPYINEVVLENQSEYGDPRYWDTHVEFVGSSLDEGANVRRTTLFCTPGSLTTLINALPDEYQDNIYFYFTEVPSPVPDGGPQAYDFLKVRDLVSGLGTYGTYDHIILDEVYIPSETDYADKDGRVVLELERYRQGVSIGSYVSYLFVPYNIRGEQGPPAHFYFEGPNTGIAHVPIYSIDASSDTEWVEVYRTVEHRVLDAVPASNLFYFDRSLGKGESKLVQPEPDTFTVQTQLIPYLDWCSGAALITDTLSTTGIHFRTSTPPQPGDTLEIYVDAVGSWVSYTVGGVALVEPGTDLYVVNLAGGTDYRYYNSTGNALHLWTANPCTGGVSGKYISHSAEVKYTTAVTPPPVGGDEDKFWHRDVRLWSFTPEYLPDRRRDAAVTPESAVYDVALSATMIGANLREVGAGTLLARCGDVLYGNVRYPTKEPRVLYLGEESGQGYPYIKIQYEYKVGTETFRGPAVDVVDSLGAPAEVNKLSVDTGFSETNLLIWIDVDKNGTWKLYERIPNAAGRYISGRNEYLVNVGEDTEDLRVSYYTFAYAAFDAALVQTEAFGSAYDAAYIEQSNVIFESVTGQPVSTRYAAIVLPVAETVRAIMSASLQEEDSQQPLTPGESAIYVFSERAVRLYVRTNEGYKLQDVISSRHGVALHPDDDSPIVEAIDRGVVYVDTEGKTRLLTGRQEQRIDMEAIPFRSGLETWQRTLHDDLWTQVVSITYHGRHQEIYLLTDTGTWIIAPMGEVWQVVGNYDYAYPTYKHVQYNERGATQVLRNVFVTGGGGAVMLDETGAELLSAAPHNQVVTQPLFVDTEPMWIHEVRVDYEPLDTSLADDVRTMSFHHQVAGPPDWLETSNARFESLLYGPSILPRRSIYPRLRGVRQMFTLSNFKELLGVRYWYVPYSGRN